MLPPGPRKKLTKTGNSSFDSQQQKAEIFANRYQVLQKLGSGSFGTVYLVKDFKNENENKVLKKILIGDLEPDETISAVGEARLLAKLNHPGIVKFYDSFISGEFFCIVTEYCEGGDLDVKLHHWKKTGKEVDDSVVVTWFIQLVLAVQYMHQRRVLHRDLKARNIFLKNNMIKIGDFGISRILVNTNDIATTVTGTPYYMAPEILKHEGYNSKSDIWSLGVILYEMCTLKKPFGGENLVSVMFKIVSGDIPSLPNLFDRELKKIFTRMLEREPSSRISASEILKTSYITQHLQNLTEDMSATMKGLNNAKLKRESREIAEALNNNKLKKKSSARPMTPKEQLKLRKQQKADNNAEILKKVTASAYNEGRRKFSKFKEEQSKVRVSFTPTSDNDSNVPNSNIEFDDDAFYSENIDNPVSAYNENNVFKSNIVFKKSITEEDEDVFNDENSLSVVNLSQFSEHVIPPEVLNKQRSYTHCFGEDISDDDVDGLSHVSSEEINDWSNEDTLNFTNVSDIPDDDALADTYYSTNPDFEDDLSSCSDEEATLVCDGEETTVDNEYGALMGYMQDALNLTENHLDATLDECNTLNNGTNNLRQQKIESLKSECIKLLGQTSFDRVYKYLNKVRFQSTTTVSEDSIMQHLRKLVGNTRDCFLVDQLLFLQKQNEISCQQNF